jgi:uncharacterized RDD family membrane protein YckC
MTRNAPPTLQVKAAPFYRRLLADLIDLGLLGAAAWYLWTSGVIAPPHQPPPRFDWVDYTADLLADPRAQLGRALVLVPTIGLLYGTVLHTVLGRTLGELLMNLRLIDGEGRVAGPFRSLLHGIGTAAGACLLLLGYLWGAVDHRRQTLAEYLSGTLLIAGRPRSGPPT